MVSISICCCSRSISKTRGMTMTSIVVPSTHAALPVPSTNFLAPRHNCGGEVEVSDLQRRVLREHGGWAVISCGERRRSGARRHEQQHRRSSAAHVTRLSHAASHWLDRMGRLSLAGCRCKGLSLACCDDWRRAHVESDARGRAGGISVTPRRDGALLEAAAAALLARHRFPLEVRRGEC